MVIFFPDWLHRRSFVIGLSARFTSPSQPSGRSRLKSFDRNRRIERTRNNLARCDVVIVAEEIRKTGFPRRNRSRLFEGAQQENLLFSNRKRMFDFTGNFLLLNNNII